MDAIARVLHKIDPVLIAPYRFFDDPMLGWWVGTFVLALWAAFLGELTLAVAYRVNRGPIARTSERTLYYHEQSLKAKQAKDEGAYKKINRLANEAYGKTFFLFIAMGMGSLWPAFFAAAWLNERLLEFWWSWLSCAPWVLANSSTHCRKRIFDRSYRVDFSGIKQGDRTISLANQQADLGAA